ncbi:serine/threonine protein kinase [Melghirimyces thermohalophilus]|uniref:Serine/threonine-protein kinase PrkC n=1 Tax=Melghirimyces thermohalophilus TaxID=1236220 RepID=A0A1G6NGN3_9BACL|nr:Stk1 family PASTA domain-containing Ser/Thr kinase [Melghirimyces thermohalophilus]SDC66978.1 serine/threonine protein kinase [Melghirimyces thermohalophilus]
MPVEGRKLGDRYELIERVGGGGMAVVYKARDVLLNRYVAIKVLNESLSNDSEFVRRFSREAQAAASLSHPNVVSVYDVGQEGHTHYIVMEYIEGPTLKEYIQQYGPLTSEEIVSIASQICDALAHAHENQIVHRDVKPHNILLGYNGRAKVTDFGIARASTSSTITQAGSVMGSVHYFSPEQARGGVIGEKSDIYSLGVVLYEMVTGRLPFDGDSAISIAMKHLQDPVENPAEINSEVPESIHQIILRAMEKDPDQRYPTIRMMKADLDAVFHHDRVEEPPLRTGSGDTRPYAVGGAAGVSASEEQTVSSQPSGQVGDQTMANLERLRHVPADKDKTMLERTVVWLENVQANMPWWQKIAFGLFTLFVIFALALFTFDTVMGWMAKDEGNGVPEQGGEQGSLQDVTGKTVAEAKNQLQGYNVTVEESYNPQFGPDVVVKQQPKAGASVGEGESITLYVNPSNLTQVDKNYVGEFQSSVSRSQFDMSWYRYPGKRNGEIIAQSPKKGQYIRPGDKVKLYIVDNGQGKPLSEIPADVRKEWNLSD